MEKQKKKYITTPVTRDISLFYYDVNIFFFYLQHYNTLSYSYYLSCSFAIKLFLDSKWLLLLLLLWRIYVLLKVKPIFIHVQNKILHITTEDTYSQSHNAIFVCHAYIRIVECFILLLLSFYFWTNIFYLLYTAS